MSIYQDRFGEDYQRLVGENGSDELHENSREMVEILQAHGVIRDGMNVFKMGSGGCRNLRYLNDANPTVNLYCNDLFYEASAREMHPSVRDKVVFYERDTLSLVRMFTPYFPVDLLIAYDHFMHIDGDSVREIVARVVDSWRPKHILIREAKPNGQRADREYPRLCHRYDFGESYAELYHGDSRSKPNVFYVKLLERVK